MSAIPPRNARLLCREVSFVKNIKQLFMGLPMFNVIAMAALWSLQKLETRFNPITENSAPITIVGAVWLLFLMGGSAICGLVFGVVKTIKHNNRLKEIAVKTIMLALILESIYIIFYFLASNDHTFLFRDASFITLEQTSGYLAGCSIGKLISIFQKRAKS